jgi:hypothetical protein
MNLFGLLGGGDQEFQSPGRAVAFDVLVNHG